VVGKKRKDGPEVLDEPFDLASRIGVSGLARPEPAAPETVRRVDGPIESDRAARRTLMIGANEAPGRPLERREPDRPAPAPAGRPMMVDLQEALAVPPIAEHSVTVVPEAAPAEAASPGAAIVSIREAPLVGEMDLVVTPLATPDDWHHFELALRRVPGVGPLRIEYYRAGILKLRLQWAGPERFAYAVANVPGYRVGILGEDRSTVQIRVARH
jgi:hypothetical protein